jgi:hypothetical protein
MAQCEVGYGKSIVRGKVTSAGRKQDEIEGKIEEKINKKDEFKFSQQLLRGSPRLAK